MTALLLGLGLLGAALAPAGAQGFQLATTSTTVLIGSPFEIIGTVDVPDGFSISKPTQTSVGEWEILDVGFQTLTAKAGSAGPEGKGVNLTLRAAVFALGQQTLPALDWPLKGPDGAPAGALQSTPVEVTVSPPALGLRDTGDIRDIKPPLRPPMWAWTLLLMSLLGLAGWLLHRRLRSRTGPGAEGGAEEEDRRTPEDIALDDLQALPSLGLPAKDFYDRLSDILRLYLERRHEIQALSMTTYDLQRRLIRAELDPKARSMLKTLLDRCDLAKFARYLPAEQEFGKDCESGRQIVRLLAPKAPEPPLAAAAPGPGGPSREARP